MALGIYELNPDFSELFYCGTKNSKEFIFAERGYIVNIGHIVQVKGNVINMVNGEQIVISRGRLADVRMKINEQWGEL